MTALPPDLFPPPRADNSRAREALNDKWAALQGAAEVVAGLAGTPNDPAFALTAALHAAPERRRSHAAQALDDLTAIMEPGLAALLAAHAGGAVIAPAARALWDEFVSAREALLAIAQGPAEHD